MKEIPQLFKQVGGARPWRQDKITQEVPRKVNGQDDGQRQQAHHRHEQDDVALEGQVGHGIGAALAADLFIPAGKFGGVGEREGVGDFQHFQFSNSTHPF